jgi:hypothetical protein
MALHFSPKKHKICVFSPKTPIFASKKSATVEDGFEYFRNGMNNLADPRVHRNQNFYRFQLASPRKRWRSPAASDFASQKRALIWLPLRFRQIADNLPINHPRYD